MIMTRFESRNTPQHWQQQPHYNSGGIYKALMAGQHGGL